MTDALSEIPFLAEVTVIAARNAVAFKPAGGGQWVLWPSSRRGRTARLVGVSKMVDFRRVR